MFLRRIAFAVAVALVSSQVLASTVTVDPEMLPAGATAPTPTKPLVVEDAEYPLQSLLSNESGTVQLNLLIDTSGKVFFAQTLKSSGTPRLDQAAVAIARTKWTFQLATKDGAAKSGNLKVSVAWKAPLELAEAYKQNVPAMANIRAGDAVDLKPPVAITSHAITVNDYPPLSIRRGEGGVVELKYLITEDGTVGDAQIVQSSTFTRLDDAAITVVKKWRFQPGILNGTPTPVWTPVEFIFCVGKCVDMTRVCRPQPNLGESMQMTPTEAISKVKVSQWIHVTESGAVDSLILQTDDGWMQASKTIVDEFSRAVHYPPAAQAKRPPSCWFDGSVTVTAK